MNDLVARLNADLADRYRIERRLGEGGMATVYLANDLRHDRLVALKVLKPELASIVGADRFLREIKTTAQLSHPHILPLFDSGAVDELLFYVMPYVEGETLADRIRREGALSSEAMEGIVTEVLGALGYAHRQGVIHRDIKPSNILLSAVTGHAIVADFGIARAISAGMETLTKPGAPIGTPSYMPPEQALGHSVTPATDVFAVGLVLYECLTGSRYELVSLSDEVDCSPLPARFRRPIQRALRPEPADRWSDADAFRDALVGSGAVPKRRWLLAGVTALVTVLGATAFLSLRTASPVSADDTRLVVLPFTVRAPGNDLDYLGDGLVDLLSAKLDGAGRWRTADPRAVLSLVRREAGSVQVSLEDARHIAQQMSGTLFVLGNVIDLGEQIRLDASLYDIEESRGVVARSTVEGTDVDVLGLIDALAAQLLSRSGGGADARLTQIASMTSQSLPALKAYLRGVSTLRRGDFSGAAVAFEEAIAADSGFALAWYQLSIAADWLLRSDLAREAADQAVRVSTRLPERDRQLLEALRAIRLGEVDSADQRLRAILGRYPDDIEAWSQLAELQFHFGPLMRWPSGVSREAWRRVIQLEPDWAAPYVHLTRVAAVERDLAGLDSLSGRALQLAPQGDRGLEMRLLRRMLGPPSDGSEELARELGEAPDVFLGELLWSASTFTRRDDIVGLVLDATMGDGRSREARTLGFGGVALSEVALGRWAAADAALRSMTALDSVRGMAHGTYLALLPAMEGYPGRLQRYHDLLADRDWRSVPNSSNRAVWFAVHDGLHEHIRLFLVGLARAFADDDSGALAVADSIVRVVAPTGAGSLPANLVETIRAVVAWRSGRPDDALAALGRVDHRAWHQLVASSVFYSQPFMRYLYGLVLEEAGRPEEALSWYGTLSGSSPTDRIFAAAAHLRQARLHEARGDRAKAFEFYQAYLALQATADPELQSVVATVQDHARSLEN